MCIAERTCYYLQLRSFGGPFSCHLRSKSCPYSLELHSSQAILATLLLYQPEVVAIGEGYHGSHCTLDIYTRTKGNVKVIDIDDDYSAYKDKTFLCWLETPVNPTGECRDMEKCTYGNHRFSDFVRRSQEF